jgi:DNA-binding Lrp family transcriptional regulator
MEIVKMEQEKPKEKILKKLLKDFIRQYTLTAIAQDINMTRSGAWKVLKKLESEELIILTAIGEGKTSAYKISLNWNNPLIEPTLIALLTKEFLNYKRWKFNFEKLGQELEILILFGSIVYSPKEAGDIDIMCIAKENKLGKIGDIILDIQQTQNKKIHAINLLYKELKQEINNKNKAYIEALKKGVVLFGQDNFVKFIRSLQ